MRTLDLAEGELQSTFIEFRDTSRDLEKREPSIFQVEEFEYFNKGFKYSVIKLKSGDTKIIRKLKTRGGRIFSLEKGVE